MLTDEQIKKLFEFCEKKQVRYYDVQLELVDHLANSIEEKIEANPSLSFEDALQIVYKGFGIFGFSHIIAENEASVYNKQRKLFYTIVKEQFGWPTIIMFIISTVLFWSLFSYSIEMSAGITLIILMSSAIILSIYTAFGISKVRKETKRKLTITSFLYESFWIYLPIYFYCFTGGVNSSNYSNLNNIQTILLAMVCSIYLVLLIAHYQTYWKVKTEVKNKYPELFITN